MTFKFRGWTLVVAANSDGYLETGRFSVHRSNFGRSGTNMAPMVESKQEGGHFDSDGQRWRF